MIGSGRTVEGFRRLVDAGVLPEDLYGRAACNYQGLSTCWCGYDMGEHGIDAIDYGDGADAPIQDHCFCACGTKWIAWMLEADNRSVFVGMPFEHDHADVPDDAHNPPVGSFCLLCRIETWEAATTSRL